MASRAQGNDHRHKIFHIAVGDGSDAGINLG